MVLRGSNQQAIYASGQLHGSDAPMAYGLVRSTDAGQSWSIVNPAGATIYGFDAYRRDPNILYGHDDSPSRAADVTLKLYNNDGVEQATAPGIRIPPNGRYAARVGDLFASSLLDAEGYLRVTSLILINLENTPTTLSVT